MFLSDNEIKKNLEAGVIKISEFNINQLQQASYDIRLGNKFLVVKWNSSLYIDPDKKIYPDYQEKILQDGEEFILHPWSSVLGTTKECFGSDEYLIQLSGKSSLARLGLIVHNTAWVVNPWHFLNMTLELANLNKIPIILRPWMEIAQLLFCPLSSIPSKNYTKTGRYKEWKKNFKI